MPPRTRGVNDVAPTEQGATVTPPAAKDNKATSSQNEEEGSTNGEAQPAAMDVDTHAPTDKGTTVTPLATKGNEDTNAETINEGSTNGEAQPAAMDVDTQSGSKYVCNTDEEDDPLTATQRKIEENLRGVREKKKKVLTQPKIRFVAATDGTPRRSPTTKPRDKVKARKSTAALTQTIFDQK